MGLDIGTRYVGVALSDPSGLIAQGLTTLKRTGDLDKDWAALVELMEENKVEMLLAGMPKNMNGTSGTSVDMVNEFMDHGRPLVEVPFEYWDERLTTMAAEKMLISGDVSRKKRKNVIDKLAATLILQGYLDYQNSKK